MKIEPKTLNDIPMVPCPFCGGNLGFDSLDAFLQAVQHGMGPRCRKCGQSVGAEREGIARVSRRAEEAEGDH